MPYVQRDNDGNINGMFANPQPDFAEEYLPDDDPEVVTFLEKANAPLHKHRTIRCCSTMKTVFGRWKVSHL